MKPSDLLISAVTLIVFAFIMVGLYANFYNNNTNRLPEQEKQSPCIYEFVSYLASPYEQLWFDHAPEWKYSICQVIRTQNAQVSQWINQLQTKDFNPEVFSTFTLKDSCTKRTITEYIEPLAGLTRHPLTCTSDHYLLDKSYLLTDCGRYAPPFKAWYFDLGSSLWTEGSGGASQQWVYNTYVECGIKFSGLFMWEASPIPPDRVWEQIPGEIRPYYHWYNIPADPTPNSPNNPLSYIKERVQPEDFLVLKIDIDNTEVEERFIQQIIADPKLMELIDELFWEHHVYAEPLASCCWGIPNSTNIPTIVDTIKYFTIFRAAGVRAHGWV